MINDIVTLNVLLSSILFNLLVACSNIIEIGNEIKVEHAKNPIHEQVPQSQVQVVGTFQISAPIYATFSSLATSFS